MPNGVPHTHAVRVAFPYSYGVTVSIEHTHWFAHSNDHTHDAAALPAEPVALALPEAAEATGTPDVFRWR